jgi:broad specificity phosphatase PhoE
MSHIYLIRHGQSTTNANPELIVLKPDLVPLTELGVEQCQKLHTILKDVNFDVVYSSPLTRAFQTANHSLDNKVLPIDALAEGDNFEAKLEQWLNTLDKSKNIAIVSHGGIIGRIANVLLNTTDRYKIDNCGYHIFEVENGTVTNSKLSNKI